VKILIWNLENQAPGGENLGGKTMLVVPASGHIETSLSDIHDPGKRDAHTLGVESCTHVGICRFCWKEYVNNDILYVNDCTPRKHIVWDRRQVFVCCMDGDEASMHTRKLLGNCNWELCEKVIQMGICDG